MSGRSLRRLSCALLGVVWACGAAAAQTAAVEADRAPTRYPVNIDAYPRPSMRATRTTAHIEIDGALDEEAWQTTEAVDEFIQSKPRVGFPASERTVVRILYDDERIYVGAICYDSEPDKVIATSLEQDFDSPNGDTFGVTFDTYHDKRNAYMFLVNPRGAWKDAQVFDDSRYENAQWEGVAYERTRMGNEGWTVEIAIPFTTMRFDPESPDHAWGLNFLRRIRRKSEEAFWAPLDRRQIVHRMSQAGTLTGLEGLRSGRNLQLKPFGVASRTLGSLRAANVKPNEFDGGMDLKYGVTTSMTLDATWRTDFSQIEVDQEQVNLTRFSLFFPEKRDFFMENAGVFTFGDLTERALRSGAGPRDFTLFHSRRIGLTDSGKPIDIVGGARLTGSAGAFQLGVLNMQTEDGPTGEAAENFTVLRLRRAVRSTSDVGAMFVDSQKTGTGSGLDYSRSYGFDVNLRPRRNMILQSYLAAVDGPGLSGNKTAGRLTVGYRDNLWDTEAFFKQIGDGFDPHVGFVRRNAMRQTYGTFGAHPRPGLRLIEEVNPYVEVDRITDLDSVLETRTDTLGFDTLFKDGSRMMLEHRDNFELVRDAFKVSSATVPAGEYSFRETSVSYQSSLARKLSARTGLTQGAYYGGDKTSVSVGALWRANAQLLFDLSLDRNDITLNGAPVTADVCGGRIRYAFSTTLFTNAFYQYNAAAKQSVINARLDFLHSPLSDLFVAYTERRDTSTDDVLERVFSVKLTKMLAF
jgi:hypothetical protein